MIQALYLHIPFCTSRCAYCDFMTSACDDEALMDAYCDALSISVRRASRAGLFGDLKTIYIGGGTPTYLGSRRLSSLIYLLSLSINLEDVEEFTVEVNPESLTDRMVKDLFALGVDRFSVGAQSFDDEVLRELGRAHDRGAIIAAVEAIRERTDRFSLDLICGAPGQDMASWEDGLRTAIGLGATHISIYPLTIEEGTPLARRIDAGECVEPDQELQAEMMLRASDMLEGAGFERYEVASYARPGHRSRHNSAYWSGVEYLGLGCGAASMLAPESYELCCKAGLFEPVGEDGLALGDITVPEDAVRVRLDPMASVEDYIASEGTLAVRPEYLDARSALLEDLMLGCRRSDGISREAVRAAADLVPELRECLRDQVERGLLRETAEGYVPTVRGWLCGNELYGAIWGLAAK